MSDVPHVRAYLCDECWNKLPHYRVDNLKKKHMKKGLDAPMSDWPVSWILLYTAGCIGCVMIIGYYLFIK